MLMLRIKTVVMVMGILGYINSSQTRQDISKIEKVFDIFHSMSLHFVDISTVNKLTMLTVRYTQTIIRYFNLYNMDVKLTR